MKLTRSYLLFWFLMVSLVSVTQEISNIHFEQVGKQIHIYYDLQGDQEYTIQVFCSTDNNLTWGQPLKSVSGAVGENQKQGKGKMIVWDVLAEREKLIGYLIFKIETRLTKKELRFEDLPPLDYGAVFFTDQRDGQTYKWVKIGSQAWMAENLNYKTYSGSWCYDNEEENCEIYGRLYEWDKAKTACPVGWHLPTDNEWKTLEMYLGMSQREADDLSGRGTDEGKKLKSTSGWYNNGNGTDAVGFTALPGGYSRPNGSFLNLGYIGYWWSATLSFGSSAEIRILRYDSDEVLWFGYPIDDGYSVRCVRD